MKQTTAPCAAALAALALAATALQAAPSQDPPATADAPHAALAPLDPELASALSQEGHFALRAGQTLKQAFGEWARAAGYTLVWEAPIDLPIEADLTFPPGTRFADAVRQTLGAFWRTKHALVGKLYRNRVLVVSGRNA